LRAEPGLPVAVRKMSVKKTRESDEVFLTATAGGLMPTSRIDGRILGDDWPGPISTRVPEALWAQRASDWHATRVDCDAHSQLR
jgi:branched-chain amino acid aminotransferase